MKITARCHDCGHTFETVPNPNPPVRPTGQTEEWLIPEHPPCAGGGVIPDSVSICTRKMAG